MVLSIVIVVSLKGLQSNQVVLEWKHILRIKERILLQETYNKTDKELWGTLLIPESKNSICLSLQDLTQG